MLLTPEECLDLPSIGNKAISLAHLLSQGYNVPAFVVIPASHIKRIYEQGSYKKITQLILHQFPQTTYAIRSCSAHEDQEHNSHAGQYMTLLQRTPNEIAEAMKTILDHAYQKDHQDLSHFSLIIQEYIVPQYAGVCFTRHPRGERQQVREYTKGNGENVVGGNIIPMHHSSYTNEKTSLQLPSFEKQKLTMMNIELFFGHPQDIERCILNDHRYILQSRPITTITQSHYAIIKKIEEDIPQSKENFLWEKNEISEVAPVPTPLTLSLLKKIYSQNGPISQVYKKYGINYTDTDFLRLVGNHLYVDRYAESATLSDSFFQKIILGWKTRRIKPDPQSFQDIKDALEYIKNNPKKDIQDALVSFFEDYKIIFQTNLIATKLLSDLKPLLQNEDISLVEIMSLPLSFFEKESEQEIKAKETYIIPPKNMQGNTLEIGDTTSFISQEKTVHTSSKEIQTQRDSKPNWKKRLLTHPITNLMRYQRYREYGRWLLLSHLSVLRKIIQTDFHKDIHKTKHQSDFYTMFTIDEYITGEYIKQKNKAQERYNQYKRRKNNIFPQRLSDTYTTSKQQQYGLSGNIAHGTIITPDNIQDIQGPKILFVQTLDPQLTQYFDLIDGIISQQGGLLSHLAIIARERNLPVIISSYDFTEELNKKTLITINGKTGERDKET